MKHSINIFIFSLIIFSTVFSEAFGQTNHVQKKITTTVTTVTKHGHKNEQKESLSDYNLVITFGLAMLTILASHFNTRKTLYNTNITAYRTKWVESLRQYASDFAACTEYLLDNDMSDRELKCKQLTAYNRARFHLNINNANEVEILDLFGDIKDCQAKEQFDELMPLLMKKITDINAYQWRKMKDEAKRVF